MLHGETPIQPVTAAPVPFEHLQGETDSRQVAWGDESIIPRRVQESFARQCNEKASHLFTHKDFWVPGPCKGPCQTGHRLCRLTSFGPHTLMSREKTGQHKI